MATARNAMLSFAMWLGVLQSVLPMPYVGPNGGGLGPIIEEARLAILLASLTMLVYKLGIWRQDWENTKHNLEAEIKALREELAACFRAMNRREEAMEHVSTIDAEARARAARWQSKVERRLGRLEAVEVGGGAAQ